MVLTEKLRKVLSSYQSQIIEQAKLTYSPLGKALGKQIKTIENEREGQIKAIDSSAPVEKKNDYYGEDN